MKESNFQEHPTCKLAHVFGMAAVNRRHFGNNTVLDKAVGECSCICKKRCGRELATKRVEIKGTAVHKDSSRDK